MVSFRKYFASILLLSTLLMVSPASAQESEGDNTGSYDSSESDGDPTGRSPTTKVTTISQVGPRLASVSALCTAVGVYTVDCLAERIEALTMDASKMDGYPEMQRVLSETAEELRLLVRDNRATALPRARLVSEDGQDTSRPLVAIAPDRIESTHAQAIRILEEAETKLLRASTRSAERANQYRQVAQALGSTKVLLRS